MIFSPASSRLQPSRAASGNAGVFLMGFEPIIPREGPNPAADFGVKGVSSSFCFIFMGLLSAERGVR